MNVLRKWVFPILRLLIFAAIAVALVKVAFFADPDSSAADPAFPTGEITEPQYTVDRHGAERRQAHRYRERG